MRLHERADLVNDADRGVVEVVDRPRLDGSELDRCRRRGSLPRRRGERCPSAQGRFRFIESERSDLQRDRFVDGAPFLRDVVEDRISARLARDDEEQLRCKSIGKGDLVIRVARAVRGDVRDKSRVPFDLPLGGALALVLAAEPERVAARLSLDEDAPLRCRELQDCIGSDDPRFVRAGFPIIFAPRQARRRTREPSERSAWNRQLLRARR